MAMPVAEHSVYGLVSGNLQNRGPGCEMGAEWAAREHGVTRSAAGRPMACGTSSTMGFSFGRSRTPNVQWNARPLPATASGVAPLSRAHLIKPLMLLRIRLGNGSPVVSGSSGGCTSPRRSRRAPSEGEHASATSWLPWIQCSSRLRVAHTASTAALSKQSPVDPKDRVMPRSAARLPKANDV